MNRVIDVRTETYRPHLLHAQSLDWTEKNCSLDVWIEVLNCLHHEPLLAAPFALAVDFQVDQWSLLKFPLDDLRLLYGVEVEEINLWRPLVDHISNHLREGRLLTLEVDAWFLPDTRGTSYHRQHGKTTIIPNAIDPRASQMEYFHGAGYWKLHGSDFDGVISKHNRNSFALSPYVESISLVNQHHAPDVLDRAFNLLAKYVRHVPRSDPVARWRRRLEMDLEWLGRQSPDLFHSYAFSMLRQFGAGAEMVALALEHMGLEGGNSKGSPADSFRCVSETTKGLQFMVARGNIQGISLVATLDSIQNSWSEAYRDLTAQLDAEGV